MRAHITHIDEQLQRKHLRSICDELHSAVLDMQRHRQALDDITVRIENLLEDAERVRIGGPWPRRPRLHL